MGSLRTPQGTLVGQGASLMVEVRRKCRQGVSPEQAFSHGRPPRGSLWCREAGRDVAGEIAAAALQAPGRPGRVWRRPGRPRAVRAPAPLSAHGPGGRGVGWEVEGLTAAERTLLVDWDTEAEGRAWPLRPPSQGAPGTSRPPQACTPTCRMGNGSCPAYLTGCRVLRREGGPRGCRRYVASGQVHKAVVCPRLLYPGRSRTAVGTRRPWWS